MKKQKFWKKKHPNPNYYEIKHVSESGASMSGKDVIFSGKDVIFSLLPLVFLQRKFSGQCLLQQMHFLPRNQTTRTYIGQRIIRQNKT